MPKNRTTRASIAFITLVVGLIVGCSSRPSDETITKDIESKIAADPQTQASAIEVVTKDGKVTLRGKATTQAAQQKAEQFARLQPGRRQH
jgi:osmotically-inducible protein OsmY